MDCSRNNVYQYISFFSFQHKAATFNSAFLHGYFILHEGLQTIVCLSIYLHFWKKRKDWLTQPYESSLIWIVQAKILLFLVNLVYFKLNSNVNSNNHSCETNLQCTSFLLIIKIFIKKIMQNVVLSRKIGMGRLFLK